MAQTSQGNETGSTGLWKLTSMRLYVALLLCYSVFCNSMMRSNFSMAMGSFVWTSSEQAMLFAAMFWGGLISGFPAGWIADRYGPKNILLGSVLSNIIGTFLTPITAERGGPVALFIIRFIMGIGQGLQYPSISSLMSRWFPPVERSTVIAIYTAGNQFAMLIIMPLGATLCENKQFLNGWPAIFYVTGLFGILWGILWSVFLTNSPEKNRKISRIESQHILSQLQDLNLQNRKANTKRIPWLSMMKSVPIWTNMAAMFIVNSVGIFLQTYLPTYFKEVLLLDIKSNGVYSALPFIAQLGGKLIFAPVADAMKRRTGVSHSLICKVFQCLGNFGTALTVMGLCFVTCMHPYLAVCLLSGICFSLAANICGFMTSLVSIGIFLKKKQAASCFINQK